MRNMFGAYGKARSTTSITFVSKVAYEEGIKEKLGLEKKVLPVMNCRTVGKKNMILNDKTPLIEVNTETYEVSIDGEKVSCEPAETLPLARRYFLF
jgi:urease subunit alpha